MGAFPVPNIFKIGNYYVFFWSNENNEPIHVHVAKGKPMPNATKIWLTSRGRCVIVNNNSQIPERELNDILDVVSAQYFMICSAWKQHFKVEQIKYFC